MATVYLLRHGEADYGPIRERNWPPDVVTAADDFERCDGEWPAGQRRSWESLSQLREWAIAALTRHLPPMNDDQVLIAVCHQMVIRALTGERNTAAGAFRRISFPGRGSERTSDA